MSGVPGPPTKRQKLASEESREPILIKYRDRARLFVNKYAGSKITYKLTTILRKLCSLPLLADSTHKIFYLDRTAIRIPLNTVLSDLFGPENFVGNFKRCWPGNVVGMSVFSKPFESSLVPGVQINVDDDISAVHQEQASRLNAISAHTFRTLFCLIVGYYYGISLPMCACYPQNAAERLLLERGLGKNCYSADCRDYLNANMYTYDPLVHGNCDGVSQTAIVIMNNFLLNSEPNVSIMQTLLSDSVNADFPGQEASK